MWEKVWGIPGVETPVTLDGPDVLDGGGGVARDGGQVEQQENRVFHASRGKYPSMKVAIANLLIVLSELLIRQRQAADGLIALDRQNRLRLAPLP
jgi:hypothetical protein